MRDGINWYAYCSNNPLIYRDPDGNIFVDQVNRVLRTIGSYTIPGYNRMVAAEENLAAENFSEAVKHAVYAGMAAGMAAAGSVLAKTDQKAVSFVTDVAGGNEGTSLGRLGS